MKPLDERQQFLDLVNYPPTLKRWVGFMLRVIKRYEEITLEEINATKINNKFYTGNTTEILTGFGERLKCSLCVSLKDNLLVKPCCDCIYVKITKDKCYKGCNSKTFYNIMQSETPEDLFTAYKERANHMKQILNKYDYSETEI